jgi:hypothetical protein
VKNLEIIDIDPATNTLFVKGAVPGARGSLLLVSGNEGTIEVDMPEASAPDAAAAEMPMAEAVVEQATA